jgi:hypothetical protein
MVPPYTIATKKTPNPIDKHVVSRVRMRRIMLAMSQEKLGDPRPHLPAGAEIRERRQPHRGEPIAATVPYLQVPVAFFFEGAPNASAPHGSNGSTSSMAEINDFISDSDGLRLIGAFMRIDNAAVRRRIVMLVQEIAGDNDN